MSSPLPPPLDRPSADRTHEALRLAVLDLAGRVDALTARLDALAPATTTVPEAPLAI